MSDRLTVADLRALDVPTSVSCPLTWVSYPDFGGTLYVGPVSVGIAYQAIDGSWGAATFISAAFAHYTTGHPTREAARAALVAAAVARYSEGPT